MNDLEMTYNCVGHHKHGQADIGKMLVRPKSSKLLAANLQAVPDFHDTPCVTNLSYADAKSRKNLP